MNTLEIRPIWLVLIFSMAEECRNKERCVFCLNDYELEGAHVRDASSFQSGEDDRSGNIICLCRICHRQFDGRFHSMHGSVELGLKKINGSYFLGEVGLNGVLERELEGPLHIKSEYLDSKSKSYVSALQFWYWK